MSIALRYMPEAPLSRRNLVSLDGLRGLAIIAVMFNHAGPTLPHSYVRYVLNLGWSGVDLFFVLSGFLITGILLDTREATNYFQSFYCRRVLRIFPLYYSFLLVALLVFPHIVRPDWMPLSSDRWLYVSYLMNWQMLWHESWHANVLGHFWSLCVEEQFYFIWPFVVLVVRPRLLLRLVIGMEITMLVGRSLWVWSHGSSVMLWTLTITRMDGLLLGAACALLIREFRLPETHVPKAILVTAPLCFAAFLGGYQLVFHSQQDAFIQSLGLAFLATGFAAILLIAVLTDSKRTSFQTCLRWKPLTRFGKYAYGIYVFHVPVFYFVERATNHLQAVVPIVPMSAYPIMLVKFGISYFAASLSYNFFEKKFLLLKDRYEPRFNLVEHNGARSESQPQSL